MSLIKLKLAGAPAALKTPKAILSPAKTPKSCVIPDNTILTPDKIIAADKNYALLFLSEYIPAKIPAIELGNK